MMEAETVRREADVFQAMPRKMAQDRLHAETVLAVVRSHEAARSAVAASWRRSLIHHGLDPVAERQPGRLEHSALSVRREAAEPLLRIAQPVLDRLAGAAAEAGCAVLLTDTEGVILEERMRPADAVGFAAAGLAPGESWSEAAEGTNGIGTCLAERRPVVVFRDQHFRARNTRLCCMGAPVFGADGEIAAVIDVSSVREDMTEGHARLVSLAVIDAARRIERELFRTIFRGARILTLEGNDTHGPILIAVDRDDLILGATRAARRNFGLTAEDVARRLPAGDVLGDAGPGGSLDEAQRSEMLRAIHRHGGNISAAARDLGIGRATFYRKMKALGRGEG